MSDTNHKIKGYTSKEAADMAKISVARIQQLARAGLIDHEYILGRLIISEDGVNQAKKRNKKVGRPPAIKANGSATK